jgi:UTP--glucose-1-phosphate uridylyltransferase
MARKENPLPDGDRAQLPVGARLRMARRQRGLALGELASQLGYSKPYLSAVENGTSRPSPAIVAAYARALGLAEEVLALPARPAAAKAPAAAREQSAVSLDATVEHIAGELGLSADESATVRRLLRDDAETRARALRASLDWWRQPGAIEVCCMPVAGWQWREWPLEQIVAAIDRGAAEAMQARIRQMVVVLPPDTISEMERIFSRSPFAERLQHFTCVGQLAPRGLGHAILQAEAAIAGRPFAVLLPDNRFDRPGAEPSVLQQLVEQYTTGIDHLVAVAKLKGQGRQYGVARLGATGARRGQRAVELLVEKPDAQHPIFRRDEMSEAGGVYAVLGRYVLSPSIVTALRAVRQFQGASEKLELLDALQWLIEREREAVAAYILPSLIQLERDQTVFVAGTPRIPTISHIA